MFWDNNLSAVWLTLFLGVLIIATLYGKSSSFRYYFKFATYIVQMQTVALFMIPFASLRPKNVTNMLIGVPFMRRLGRFLGIRFEISGEEILAKDFSCLIISNHQTMLDVLVMIELWPIMKKCAAVGKRAILYVFPFGFMTWLCGMIFIDRRNPEQSQVQMSTSAEKIRENNTKMWIFPEGTRSKKEALLPFKKGAFHIAVKHKLPIVPVIISPYAFIDDEKKIFNAGTIKIKILNPIDTSDLQYPNDVSKLAETCHELMDLEFQRMKAENQLSSGNECGNKEISMNGNIAKHANGHGQVLSRIEKAEKRRTSQSWAMGS